MALPAAQPRVEHLPAFDARLINPRTDKFDTPIDDRGLVDVDRLIADVKATIDLNYEWPLGSNEHHFYWPKAFYPLGDPDNQSTLSTFRELPVSKGKMPQAFHNWLHKVTLPPEVPEIPVMERRIEAWQIASSLFQSLTARRNMLSGRLTRRHKKSSQELSDDEVDRLIIEQIAEDQFPIWHRNIQLLERLDPEFRLVEPTDGPKEVDRKIGGLVTHKNMFLVPAVVG